MQGSLEQAISYYTKALRSDPFLAEVHNDIGMAFLRRGMAKEAALHFEEALKIHPGDQKAERNLRSARERLESTQSGQSSR